eukprot:5174878-Pleurochrysis_carterae.AAC.1
MVKTYDDAPPARQGAAAEDGSAAKAEATKDVAAQRKQQTQCSEEKRWCGGGKDGLDKELCHHSTAPLLFTL